MCGASDAESVLELEAAEFCKTNWTYSSDFRSLLGLPERAMFPIRRCRRCAMVFAGLLPDDAFLTTLYDRVIREADCIDGSENRASYARRLRYVAELIDLAPEGPALDFGSGIGVTLRILRACNIAAVGVDPSAMRREHSGNVVATLDDAAARGPFAMLILDNVLEHLPDPVGVVRRLSDVCVTNAVAYVSVPSYEREFLQKQIDAHRRGADVDMTLNPWEHLNYFTLEHLDRLMEGGGFRRLAAPAIGLRAEKSAIARMKNSAASALRLARYALTGSGIGGTEHAFYRRG